MTVLYPISYRCHMSPDVWVDLSDPSDVSIKPPLGLGPDLCVTRLAQLGEDEAAQESVQVTLTLLGVPGHLALNIREQIKLELSPGVVKLLVGNDDGDLGQLLRDVVPHDVAVLCLVGLQ